MSIKFLNMVLAVIIINFVIFGSVLGNLLTLYLDRNQEGEDLEFILNNCTDLPRKFAYRVSSLDAHGKCVRLYTEAGCDGNRVEIKAKSDDGDDLRKINFDDLTVSVNRCPPSRSEREEVLKGEYVLQSMMDGKVLSAVGNKTYSGKDARIRVQTWKYRDNQRWTIRPFSTSGTLFKPVVYPKNSYEIIPLRYSFNNPISYGPGGVGPEGPFAKKIMWFIDRLSNGKYMFRRRLSDGKFYCLSNDGEQYEMTYEICEPKYNSGQWRILKEKYTMPSLLR